MTELEAKNACEWETKMTSFKERGSKLLKWDPSAAKNKDKPETNELIEEEEDLLPPQQEEQTQNVTIHFRKRTEFVHETSIKNYFKLTFLSLRNIFD